MLNKADIDFLKRVIGCKNDEVMRGQCSVVEH